ncbi:hypothetical protein [Actinomadura sp. K4S16]|uniref:hypothetical protein n=1 Tax=Actinomadura sp. K4S16 TaxID=1316147 RepID=UPI0011EFECC9|nr:hypothetical protein [Actinomadura sp. K4S16]
MANCEVCERNAEMDRDLDYPASPPNEAVTSAMVDGEIVAICGWCITEQRAIGNTVEAAAVGY